MDDIVEVDLNDATKYGLERLERIILHNIENEGKIVKIDKAFTKTHGIYESLQKYNIGDWHEGKPYDANYFQKDAK